MADIEWKTYIEPVEHVLAQVTEGNVLDFVREYGWTLSIVEKAVAPFPTGRAHVMQVVGVKGAFQNDSTQVPFWVEVRGDNAYRSSAPRVTWVVAI